jgi:hypothetical protein
MKMSAINAEMKIRYACKMESGRNRSIFKNENSAERKCTCCRIRGAFQYIDNIPPIPKFQIMIAGKK